MIKPLIGARGLPQSTIIYYNNEHKHHFQFYSQKSTVFCKNINVHTRVTAHNSTLVHTKCDCIWGNPPYSYFRKNHNRATYKYPPCCDSCAIILVIIYTTFIGADIDLPRYRKADIFERSLVSRTSSCESTESILREH